MSSLIILLVFLIIRVGDASLTLDFSMIGAGDTSLDLIYYVIGVGDKFLAYYYNVLWSDALDMWFAWFGDKFLASYYNDYMLWREVLDTSFAHYYYEVIFFS